MSFHYFHSLIHRCRRKLRWYEYPSAHWRAESEHHKWVFVTGCNRSGKTILANLFGNHPVVSVIPNASNQSSVFPNAVSEECPHVWTEKLEKFRQSNTGEQCVASRLAFDWLSYHRNPRRVILVESSLAAVQMPWLQSMFRNSCFIGIVRNGYAVAEGIRLKEGYAIERCARHWNTVNRIMVDDAKLVSNFRLVQYERFVAQPMEVAKEVASLIGIDASPLEPFARNGWCLGNEDQEPSKLRNTNPDLASAYAANGIEKVAAQAGEMLSHFGYKSP